MELQPSAQQKSPEKYKLNFFCGDLFHMKNRVCLKYFVHQILSQKMISCWLVLFFQQLKCQELRQDRKVRKVEKKIGKDRQKIMFKSREDILVRQKRFTTRIMYYVKKTKKR